MVKRDCLAMAVVVLSLAAVVQAAESTEAATAKAKQNTVKSERVKPEAVKPEAVKPDATAADAKTEAAQPLEIPSLAYITLMIARDPSVQAELKLSPEQIDRVGVAVTEVDQPFWLLRDVPLATASEQLDALHQKFRQQLQGILTTVQLGRLNEIILRARASNAFLSADLPQRLKLSEQTTRQIRDLIAQAKPEDTDTWKKVSELLSPQQQTILSRMIGKPFDFSRVLRIGCVAPEMQGVTEWINSEPLKLADLRGKVVVVHFWTFGCINCVHNLPHYQSWYEKFPSSRVTIIGIHTPETASERKIENVRSSIPKREIKYPVAVDMEAANWKAWANNVWPAVYLIDKQGRVRAWWYGELNWEGAHGEENMRKKIDDLLAEPV